MFSFVAARYRCVHRSHLFGWRCPYTKVWDGYCQRHNRTCFTTCGGDR
jgi:hypothetical protein